MSDLLSGVPPRGRGDTRLWPFGARAALLTAGAILVLLLAVVAIARVIADWPSSRWDGWLLIGVLVFTILPVVLLVLDRVARSGGSVEVRGMKIAFAAEARSATVTLPGNMGVPPGLSVADSGSGMMISALRNATENDVVVVDLENGRAWWETRLLVLCSGAQRLSRVRAVVFVATDHAVLRTFQGWAPPIDILTALLDARPDYRHAAEVATVNAQRWRLAYPPGATGAPAGHDSGTNPLPDPVAEARRWMAFDGDRRNDFADEQMLLAELAPLEATPPVISIVRLEELFAPVLRHVTLDEAAPDDDWLRTALSCEDEYIAVTRGQVYVGLLSRMSMLTRILAAVADRSR